MDPLIEQAGNVYSENFSSDTYFGRCIFLSWYCSRGTCDFCFRSTTKHQIKHAANARRSLASILTDAIVGKALGWRIEFLTGGYGIFDFKEILEVARLVSKVYNEKIWVNLGALSAEEMERLQPYVSGVCASIETVEEKLHDKVCPDKPIDPYTRMLNVARCMGFKTGMTIVIGLGEKKEDFALLADYISANKIERVTFYALKPVKGTPYTKSPEPDYYAWWIAKTRIAFPKLKIMAGLTPKKIDYAELILKAGANGITKFPAVRRFGSSDAQSIEDQAKAAGRHFEGTLTRLPDLDWDSEVDKIGLDDELSVAVKANLAKYIKSMSSKE